MDTYLLLFLIAFIILAILSYLVLSYIRTPYHCPIYNNPVEYPENPPILSDTVRQYDYNKMFDPLEEPARRVPRHELYPMYLKGLLDLPTRGYPDNFTQIGILIRQDDNNKDNKILRLFSRQEYPGSSTYEYYTAINNGNDQIKIPLRVKHRELYEDDIVYVKEMDADYKVQLHRYDQPRYYPFV